MHRIVETIITLLPEMTRTENRITHELIESPTAIEKMTLAQIVGEAGSSEEEVI